MLHDNNPQGINVALKVIPYKITFMQTCKDNNNNIFKEDALFSGSQVKYFPNVIPQWYFCCTYNKGIKISIKA